MHSKGFPPKVQDPSAARESPSPDNLLSSAVYQKVRLHGVLHLHLLPPLPIPPPAGQAAPLADLGDSGQEHATGRAHRRRTQPATDVCHLQPHLLVGGRLPPQGQGPHPAGGQQGHQQVDTRTALAVGAPTQRNERQLGQPPLAGALLPLRHCTTYVFVYTWLRTSVISWNAEFLVKTPRKICIYHRQDQHWEDEVDSEGLYHQTGWLIQELQKVARCLVPNSCGSSGARRHKLSRIQGRHSVKTS